MTPEPEPDYPSASDLANRRREGRRPVQARLRMVVETEAIAGLSDNLSKIGVLFSSEEPLRVRVEVVGEDGGEERSFTGRLVRVQRMSAERTGFAVEFD